MNTTTTRNKTLKKSPKKNADQLKISRIFDAPRERLWEAWTNAEKLKLWFKPSDEIEVPSIKADPRVGGRYRIQMKHPDGEFYTAVGTYREVKAPERLVFS